MMKKMMMNKITKVRKKIKSMTCPSVRLIINNSSNSKEITKTLTSKMKLNKMRMKKRMKMKKKRRKNKKKRRKMMTRKSVK